MNINSVREIKGKLRELDEERFYLLTHLRRLTQEEYIDKWFGEDKDIPLNLRSLFVSIVDVNDFVLEVSHFKYKDSFVESITTGWLKKKGMCYSICCSTGGWVEESLTEPSISFITTLDTREMIELVTTYLHCKVFNGGNISEVRDEVFTRDRGWVKK